MQNSPSIHHHHSFLQFTCSMSSSASFMPQQVEPPTTIQTKSSFSEIEPVQEPSLYHLTLSDPSFISSSLYTTHSIEPFTSPLTETNLNYHKSTFSSVEAKRHYVDSFIRNQKAVLQQEQELQRKTKAEIQSLIPLDTRSLDELVLDDSHQQWADLLLSSTTTTASRKRFSFSSLPISDRRVRTPLVHSWLSTIVDYKGLGTTGNTAFGTEEQLAPHRMNNSNNDIDGRRSSGKQWLKSLTRWIRLGQGKKRDKVDQNNDDEYHHYQYQYQRQQQQQSPLSLATMTATAIEENKLRHEAMVDSTLDDDYQQYDERRHQSKKAARHVSWSIGTSFEEYKLCKSRRMEQDFYGNDTRRGAQRQSKPPHLFLPTRNAPAAYMEEPPLPPTPTLMTTPTTVSFLPHSAPTSPTSSTNQKRGFGFSFVQRSLSSTTRSLLRPRNRLTQRRKRKVYHIDPQDSMQTPPPPPLEDTDYMDGDEEFVNAGTMNWRRYFDHQRSPLEKDTHKRRYSSGHLIEKYSPRLSALKEEADVAMMAANRQNLVAFRYPRMVRMKDLRGASNHILSAEDDELGDGEQMNCVTDDGRYIGSGGWISGRHLYNLANQKPGANDQCGGDNDFFGVEMGDDNDDDADDNDDDDDNSLVKYSRQYRNSTKRFSDPGAGLSAPPFPIGRPLSSFYD